MEKIDVEKEGLFGGLVDSKILKAFSGFLGKEAEKFVLEFCEEADKKIKNIDTKFKLILAYERENNTLLKKILEIIQQK